MMLITWHKFWPALSAVLYAMNMIIALYASISMILRKQDPVKTLSWTAVMILLPYLGIILYLTFGQNYRKSKLFSRKGVADYRVRSELCEGEIEALEQIPELLSPISEPYRKLIYQNLRNSHSLLDFNKDIEFYFNGKDALDAMYKSIEGAKNHIHLQTYILEDDSTGRRFVELLKAKAKEGVEVRIMYDAVGSSSLKKRFRKELQEAGIEVLVFSPVWFLMPMSKVNYRNHRKILVVDGIVGFLGGVNIADRYYFGIDGKPWIDTQVKITGESTYSLQYSFLLDRYFVQNRKIRLSKKYYPKIKTGNMHLKGEYQDVYTQIISSGPDSDWAGIMQCFFTAITSASSHIYIETPYFTPNETILNAIKVAALGNIDVRLLIPEKGDSIAAHYCTRSYITELLEAGVKVYLFNKGFNHSKVISADGAISIVGSANLDARSLEHNFEIMAVLYKKDCSAIVERQFIQDLEYSTKIELEQWKKRSASDKIKESFYRLLSPLM